MAIDDAGSSTDEDEDKSMGPPLLRASSRSPSPSVASKSAKRRVEASTPLLLPRPTRKRRTDALSLSDRASKLTRTSKGQQVFIGPQPPTAGRSEPCLIKKPSLEMMRSYNGLPASQSTANTSFNTVSSSQQTRVDTANTSFTSNGDTTEVAHDFPKSTSSTTMGSLNDGDLLVVNAKLSKEGTAWEKSMPSNSSSQGRDSASNWGSSIPEDDLFDASAKGELTHVTTLLGSKQLSPRRRAEQVRSSRHQPKWTPIRINLPAQSMAAQDAVDQAFPHLPKVNVGSPLRKLFQSAMQPSGGVSPTRVQQPLIRDHASSKPPPKMNHHIRDIPRLGLFVSEPPSALRVMPYFAVFICQRIALEQSIPLAELVRRMDIAQACIDPNVFWANLAEHPDVKSVKIKDSNRLWSAAEHNFEGFTFKGQINLRNKQAEPIFGLELHPILPEKSCRFQRKYGSHRFLYLDVPKVDMKSWNCGNGDDRKLIRQRWEEWLHTEHSFLHRKWRVFHLEPTKKKGKKNRKNEETTHDFRIILFATAGSGIDKNYTVGEMLNWFLPFAANMKQSFCKAFARYDLGLSRTTPTLVFKPTQVYRISDTWSNTEKEATDFDDPNMTWAQPPLRQVMNDGCSVMSVGAALEIWRKYKKIWGVEGPLPSVFQGRIGGAKGLWMISAESYTKDPIEREIWIRISDSQMKFEPHPEDLSDIEFDHLRLTFEVSNYSSTAAPSELHVDFIPIMTDRGVPKDVIAEYMRDRLDDDRIQLLDKIRDPLKTYEYVHKNSSTSIEGADMPWQAAMPVVLEDKIKLLLESGFSPLELQILAKNLERFVIRQQLSQESKLRTPLGKATFLYGLADPTGLLRPGEIHVQFSSSFVDQVTNEAYLNLKAHKVLVARQPAIRISDIQKVRAVLLPELSHLVDVVVFSTRGQCPLASKLQGGDYDGDIFWLCWEEKLVTPFRNAPAPVESPDPWQYGIHVDRTTLEQLRVDVRDDSSIDCFLRQAIKFRSVPSILGIATTYFRKQSYLENRLSSSRLDHLVNIHDLLVDAAKQGYTFGDQDWRRYLRGSLKCDPNLKLAVHTEAMDACAAVKDHGADLEKARNKKYRYNKDNIIDYLYFDVVRVHNIATVKELQLILSSAREADPHLLFPRQQLQALNDPIVNSELLSVQEEILQLYASWNANMHSEDKRKGTKELAKTIEDLHSRFLAIKPSNTAHPTIRSWLHPWLQPGSCLWDRLRASILYASLPQHNAQTFVFQMAGNELAKIKAERFPRTRSIVEVIRAGMKPKPIRASVQEDGELSDEIEDDETEQHMS